MAWLKDLLNEPGRQVPPIGTFMKIPAVETIEIVKLAGFDFIVLDAEHAPLSMSDLNHMILVARALGMPPIVRVPDHGYGDVQRVLDSGAAGLFFPHVADRAECEQVVRQASHPLCQGRRREGNADPDDRGKDRRRQRRRDSRGRGGRRGFHRSGRSLDDHGHGHD